MQVEDHQQKRAATIAGARMLLGRLRVAALTGSILAFGGMTAGIALETAGRATAATRAAGSATVSAASVTTTTTAATSAAAAPVPTSTPTAAPAAAAPVAAPMIVSAQS